MGGPLSLRRHPCLQTQYPGPQRHSSRATAWGVVHDHGNDPAERQWMAARKSLGVRERSTEGLVAGIVKKFFLDPTTEPEARSSSTIPEATASTAMK